MGRLKLGGRRGRLLATGQTTPYPVGDEELDDGHYEKGLAKKYQVLSTGSYSGTSNIDLIHFTDTDVSFADADPDTITSVGTDLDGIFASGDVIVITGDSDNNGTYTIASVSSKVITLDAGDELSTEAAGDTVNIAKREALSNNCVLDQNTGLMWARYTSAQNAKMGAASDGKMPWTGELYDIFQWCAAANVAALGGYSDWRIPNDVELAGLRNMEGSDVTPDSIAFPGWPASSLWSSTTRIEVAARAMYIGFVLGSESNSLKTTVYYVALVRGGV